MAYTEFNGSDTNITDIFTYAADTVPILPQMILFGMLVITVMSSYFASKRLTGRGNFAGSLAVGSLITCICAITLSFIPNFIRSGTVIFYIGLAIFGFLWLAVSRSSETI